MVPTADRGPRRSSPLISMSEVNAPERLRLFVAINIPHDIKDRIEKAQSELRRALAQNSVRWTSPEHLHLTLRFLGNVPAARLDQLTEALRSACRGSAALRLRAEGIGFFPPARPA